MSGLRLLRAGTAALLLASGLAFSIGTHLERASHHETAAEHARETAALPVPTPLPTATTTPTPSPATTHVSKPTTSATPSKDPRLSAPEGSKAREAGERAARQAKATPTRTPPAAAAPATPSSASTGSSPSQAPEGSAEREAAERATASHAPSTQVGATDSHSENSEKLFGVNTESTRLVITAVAVTVLAALLLLVVPHPRPLRRVALGTFAFCVAATALDIRESIHQHSLGQGNVLAAALVVAILHATAGTGALALATGHPRASRP